jgi:hypothetical protein
MTVRLSNDDSCAVDLLLESGNTGQGSSAACYSAAPSAQLQQRLTRVEQILHLLDLSTPAEPSFDLVSRTLARCEQAAESRRATDMSVPAPVVAAR